MQNDFEFHYAQVLRASEGACLVKFKIAARLLGVSVQTIYNQVSAGDFKFDVVKAGSRSYVRALDLARHIAGIFPTKSELSLGSLPVLEIKRSRGRPRKELKAQRIAG